MFIEDDGALLDTLSTLLRSNGFSVFEAVNENEGIHQIRKTQPDVILLDWYLNNKTGLLILKEANLNYRIPVVVLSGKLKKHGGADCIKQGAADFIEKPPDIHDLAIRLQHAGKERYKNRNMEPYVYGSLRIDFATSEKESG